MTVKKRTLAQEIAWRLAGVYAAQTHGSYDEETLFDRGGDWAADEVGKVLSERLGVPAEALETMSESIMAERPARVLIGEIARLQALLKAHQDMLLRLYQDTVTPSTRYCYRCGCQDFHDENCAMAEVEELLGLEFDVEEEDDDEQDDE